MYYFQFAKTHAFRALVYPQYILINHEVEYVERRTPTQCIFFSNNWKKMEISLKKNCIRGLRWFCCGCFCSVFFLFLHFNFCIAARIHLQNFGCRPKCRPNWTFKQCPKLSVTGICNRLFWAYPWGIFFLFCFFFENKKKENLNYF